MEINVEQTIKQKLKEIEDKYEVTILFAVESGSRAWGFSSSDSDWDVRFVYCHRPSWYFTVFPGRDVIEEMDKELNLDFSGWELNKALGLLYKGNPPLLEWLQSPQTYVTHPEAYPELQNLAKAFYSPKTAIYHYLHMAKGNYKSYIEDRHEVLTKKYLYIVRPLLACKWVETYGTFPPMEIDTTLGTLLTTRELTTHAKIAKLLEKKRDGRELGLDSPDLSLNIWIEENLLKYTEYAKSLESQDKDVKLLDKYADRWINKLK